MLAAAIVAFAVTSDALPAQTPPAKAPKAAKVAKNDAKKTDNDTGPKKPKVSKLFKAESPAVEAVFTANLKQLRREKKEGAPYHPATISYTDSTGKKVDVPMRARTRGIWRLANCEFPPLRFNFANKSSKATLFDDLDEPKFVSYCKGAANAEQLVLRELQLYRIYRLLTPASHETRLMRVTYTDSATAKAEFTRYAIMVEDPARMAERMGGKMLDQKGAQSDDLDANQSAIMFLFLYMIGNTDFSISGLHNGELLRMADGRVFPVAYDFDFSGAVDAPYASPPPQLRIKSVRQRQFRGYCQIKDAYPAVVALMQSKKDAIYALYTDAIGSLMEPKSVKETLEYYDEFYKDIATPKQFDNKLYGDCIKVG
ncbi:MAG: hypothetical protein ABIW79_00580 [Gemmatimonas sp.]